MKNEQNLWISQEELISRESLTLKKNIKINNSNRIAFSCR